MASAIQVGDSAAMIMVISDYTICEKKEKSLQDANARIIARQLYLEARRVRLVPVRGEGQ